MKWMVREWWVRARGQQQRGAERGGRMIRLMVDGARWRCCEMEML